MDAFLEDIASLIRVVICSARCSARLRAMRTCRKCFSNCGSRRAELRPRKSSRMPRRTSRIARRPRRGDLHRHAVWGRIQPATNPVCRCDGPICRSARQPDPGPAHPRTLARFACGPEKHGAEQCNIVRITIEPPLTQANPSNGPADKRRAGKLEPHTCDGWTWFDWTGLCQPLFAPLQSLVASGYIAL